MSASPINTNPDDFQEPGLPVDIPSGSILNSATPQVTAQTGEIVAGKEPAAFSSFSLPEMGGQGKGAHSSPRISAKQLEKIAASLSPRDWNILNAAGVYRFVTARQLTMMFFHDHASDASAARTARRVLSRLRSLRILGVVERRIGGIRAGSEGMVYYLDTAGERLHRNATGSVTRKRFEEPSPRFMDHTLAITNLAAELYHCGKTSGAEIVSLTPEPRRNYTAPHGGIGRLSPDLAVELAAHHGAETISAFFVEIDLGHESLPTLINKALAYEQYRASGEEQRKYGGFPRIVWVMDSPKSTTTQRRIEAFSRAIEEHPQIPHHLHTITTNKDAAAYLINEANQ